jgi:peroxiredoxin
MKTRSLVLFLGLAAALVGLPGCKGSGPTDPEPPTGNITFRGTITSGGAPLAGVPVFLSGDVSKSTVTDAAGAFSFMDVTGTIFVVTPSLQNHEFTPSNYELTGQSRSDLAFVFGPATYGSIIGRIAADFTAVNQNGQTVSLYDYFGKVVLIDFSADWCGPCQSEAQKAESLYQEYKNKGFEMLTIMIDGSPSAWATTYGLTFSVLDDDAETLWGIFGEGYIPLNIVLDRNMTIRYKQAGYYESQITGTIKKFL